MSNLSAPVDPARDHIEGKPDAPVTLVEYGDYECPYCGKAYPIVKSIQAQMGDQLRFVFRNFPLTELHPHAAHAALAAETAGKQGKFWEMHDALYENQKALGDSHLREYAQSVGLDADAFMQAVENGDEAEQIEDDFSSGVRSGVNGTPTFFINGVRHDDGWDEETLLAALQAVG